MHNTAHTIRRVLSGDLDAYGDLVRRYQREVARVVTAMLLDRQETEDLVQQVFITAYESLDQFQPDRDFAAWVKGIARNQVRMYLRKRATTQRVLQHYHDFALARMDEQVDEGREAALKNCCQALAQPSQQIIKLRYRDGQSLEAIAAHMNRTLSAVTKLLSRTRLMLRDCIQQKLAHT